MSAGILLACRLLICSPSLLQDARLRCMCLGRVQGLSFLSGFGRGDRRLVG